LSAEEELKLEESRLEESRLLLAWLSRSGAEYDVDVSDDLEGWAVEQTLEGTGERIEAVLPVDGEEQPQRFFRVRERAR